MTSNLGFILMRSPHGSDSDSIVLKAGLKALGKGDGATILLIGDSVWLANKLNTQVEKFIRKGGKVMASGEHLKANGLTGEELLSGVEIISDPYDKLVDLVMERFDKVVII